MVRNDTDADIIFPKKIKLGHVIENESKSTEYYAIDSDEHISTAKTPKR